MGAMRTWPITHLLAEAERQAVAREPLKLSHAIHAVRSIPDQRTAEDSDTADTGIYSDFEGIGLNPDSRPQ
jgi:hypothetical protein